MCEERTRKFLVTGKTDMRKGIDGLIGVLGEHSDYDIFDTEAIFLFCGGKKDRFKMLHWEKDGFVLTYKRIESGKLHWPKEEKEKRVQLLNHQEFKWLLEGLSIVQPRAIKVAEIGSVI